MNRLCIRGIVGGAVAFIYVTAPSQQNFDVNYAPDSTPAASVISFVHRNWQAGLRYGWRHAH